MLIESGLPIAADAEVGIALNGRRQELEVMPWTILFDRLREML